MAMRQFMEIKDKTGLSSYRGIRKLSGLTDPRRDIEVAERFRIHLHGLYHVEAGSWRRASTRAGEDLLHHIHLVASAGRQAEHNGQVTELTPGYAWFLPGGTTMKSRCDEGCEVFALAFRCEWLPGVDPLLDWPERRPVRLGRWDESMLRCFMSFGRRQTTAGLLRLLAQVNLWLAEALPDFERIIQAHILKQNQYARVFELIEMRLGADLRVADLAAVMGMSNSTFSMGFNRSFGLRPKVWLDRRLNQEAIRLLIQTGAKTKAIAAQLRFADQYHFSRFFKRNNGVAPGLYRRQGLRPGSFVPPPPNHLKA